MGSLTRTSHFHVFSLERVAHPEVGERLLEVVLLTLAPLPLARLDEHVALLLALAIQLVHRDT